MNNYNDSDCYVIKKKDGTMLEFYYDINDGIYMRNFEDDIGRLKYSIYKNSFRYFCVLESNDDKIYIFCQDRNGDIILCRLEDNRWSYKTLLQMKSNVIRASHIKAFIDGNDIHLFYNIIDGYTNCEILIHQMSVNEINWSNPEVVSRLSYYSYPYHISKDHKSNIIILNAIFSKAYILISRKFHIIQGRWGKEELIHTSLLPYIDFSFFIEEENEHYLFITQDDMTNKVIYQKRKIGFQKNTVLFEDLNIKSCLIGKHNNILYASWICRDKLYGCISKDDGESFINIKVYRKFNDMIPRKIYYHDYSNDDESWAQYQEVYSITSEGKEKLFIDDISEESAAVEHDESAITDSIYKEGNVLEKFEVLRNKNRQLNKQLEVLKEKNNSLVKKIILKDRDKFILEKKLTAKEFEKKNLKYQINLMIKNKRH